MTDTHQIVEGRVVCGICPATPGVSFPSIEKLHHHLRRWHGAPHGIVFLAPSGLAFEGEVRTWGWPANVNNVDVTTTITEHPTTQQGRGAAARDRELRPAGRTPGWFAGAACRGSDPNLFFPDPYANIDESVRQVCAACPVREDCADLAIAENEKHGIWGGLSEKQRRRARRERISA